MIVAAANVRTVGDIRIIIPQYTHVRLLHDLDDNGTTIPAGTIGVVVDILGKGAAYTVDFDAYQACPTVLPNQIEIVIHMSDNRHALSQDDPYQPGQHSLSDDQKEDIRARMSIVAGQELPAFDRFAEAVDRCLHHFATARERIGE